MWEDTDTVRLAGNLSLSVISNHQGQACHLFCFARWCCELWIQSAQNPDVLSLQGPNTWNMELSILRQGPLVS